MGDSVSMDSMVGSPRPQKIPKLDNPGEESKPTTVYGRLRPYDQQSDEYVRQFLLFHYDFYRTQGFGIDWNKFDYFFDQCDPYYGAPPLCWTKTNEEIIQETTLRAIAMHNEENGTNIVFVEHIEANYAFSNCLEQWITFWGKDMASPCPEPKIYQTHVKELSGRVWVPIFRLKPTEEEMAAAPVHVEPPFPFRCEPPVEFSFAGPGDEVVPGTPDTFIRDPPKEDSDSGSECSCDDCSLYFNSTRNPHETAQNQ